MASPEPIVELNGKVDEPWKPPQRPGKLGVDYDELGAEMAPNARVWKKYVEETDRMDKELVEGWNGSLDIILIFAALFSAISTAFVIESSKDLKPDYSQTSAQTLQLMSQTLSAIARGSPLNDSDTMVTEIQEFTPSSSAIAVNTLWFLSLGLSVAVSLIAILAKEWCHSFMAGRVGSMLRQARLRQQRWDGIEKWKMKEILYVLPLLMHIALLLFAVGLSLYLWDINIRVALPVVIITSLVALFYLVTVSLPLFFRFCPYTTALARFLYPYWLALLGHRYTMNTIGALVASLGWTSHYWLRLKQIIIHRVRSTAQDPHRGNDIEATGDSPPNTLPFAFRDTMQEVHYSIQTWLESMRAMFSTDRSQLVEKDTPMDAVASSMITWMIVNCEDSRSVDMALQALAGADQALPRLPLWQCGAIDLLYQRIIDDCLVPLSAIPSDGLQKTQNTFLDDASLYSRSLRFLTAFVAGEGTDVTDTFEVRFVVKDNHDWVARFQQGMSLKRANLFFILRSVLYHAWNQPIPRYELVAYELNAFPVKASTALWTSMEASREQCQKQLELLQHMSSGKVSNLPASAIFALINGITKTYLYNALHSPKPLIKLLHFLESPNNPDRNHGYALRVGLTVAALATGGYHGEHTKVDQSQTNESRLILARDAYMKLTETTGYVGSTPTLLCFGLLSFLNHKTEGKWTLDAAEIKVIRNHLDSGWIYLSYHEAIPGVPESFNVGHHLVQVLSELISALPSDIELDCNSGAVSSVLSRIEAALGSLVCGASSDSMVPFLTQHFTSTDSVQLKRLCLRGIKYSLGDGSDRLDIALDSLGKTNLLMQVMKITTFTHNDPAMIPYCMEFLWAAGRALLGQTEGWHTESRRSVARVLLESFDNPFKISSTEDGLPQNRDEMGLADSWLPKIDEICQSSPHAVLDSNLLSAMIEFYEYEERKSLKPRTTELPNAFESTWTWLQILRYWKESCQEVIEKQTKDSKPLDKEPESTSTISGVGRRGMEDKLSRDIQDWSI